MFPFYKFFVIFFLLFRIHSLFFLFLYGYKDNFPSLLIHFYHFLSVQFLSVPFPFLSFHFFDSPSSFIHFFSLCFLKFPCLLSCSFSLLYLPNSSFLPVTLASLSFAPLPILYPSFLFLTRRIVHSTSSLRLIYPFTFPSHLFPPLPCHLLPRRSVPLNFLFSAHLFLYLLLISSFHLSSTSLPDLFPSVHHLVTTALCLLRLPHTHPR